MRERQRESVCERQKERVDEMERQKESMTEKTFKSECMRKRDQERKRVSHFKCDKIDKMSLAKKSCL